MCDRVTRWLSPFRLFIRYHLIVKWFSGLIELPSSAPILVGWAEYSRLWLRWSPGYLIFRCCSFTYRWPYDRFWISHIVLLCFRCIVLLLGCQMYCQSTFLPVWGRCLYCQSINNSGGVKSSPNMLSKHQQFWGGLLMYCQSTNNSEGVS